MNKRKTIILFGLYHSSHVSCIQLLLLFKLNVLCSKMYPEFKFSMFSNVSLFSNVSCNLV